MPATWNPLSTTVLTFMSITALAPIKQAYLSLISMDADPIAEARREATSEGDKVMPAN
jgi:hypothetical protein